MKFRAVKKVTDWTHPSGIPLYQNDWLGAERDTFEEVLEDIKAGAEVEKGIKVRGRELEGFFIEVQGLMRRE